MPPAASSGKGRGSASMRETPLRQRFDGSVWAFDAFLFGRSGQFPLYDENSSGADQLCRQSLRHAGAAVCLCDDAGSARHLASSRSGSSCLDATTIEPSARTAWSLADRSPAAFAVSQFDLHDKTETYEIFRHPAGGRKDLSTGAVPTKSRSPNSKSTAQAANSTDQDRRSRIAARMDPDGMRELEAAGVIDSKFGTVDATSPGRRR